MTAIATRSPRASAPPAPPAPPVAIVRQGAAALAASMGVGRFVYTPILPLMHAQAGLSAGAGAALATSNYIGYLLGALAATARPSILGSRTGLRAGMAVLVATLALMPVTRSEAAWYALRLVAGAASALVFVIAVSGALAGLRGHADHLVGWIFGGIGGGIALSGAAVLALRNASDWRTAWWSAAVLAAVLSALAWPLVPVRGAAPSGGATGTGRRRWFAALLTSYTLEGIGYIIAATFLVAAIDAGSSSWLGPGTWVVVGLAAVPASAGWALLGRWRSRPSLLCAALGLQAVGIALPALAGGPVTAVAAAVLFGATFLGVGSLSLALGAHLQVPRAVALLTVGYGVGQIVGPLIAAPLLPTGYPRALGVAAGVVAAAALAAGWLRVGFPHRVGVSVEPSRARRGT